MTKNKSRRKLDLSPEKIAASKARKQGLRKLATSVREMTEEEQQVETNKFGLIPSIAGYELSSFNSIFLRRQRANVSEVGGFNQWRKAGRKVKKGSKAISIWLPCKKKEKTDAETGETIPEEKFFRLVNVFDILDTELITAPAKEDSLRQLQAS